MQEPYTQPFYTNHPGCIVILIEQSKTMAEEFGDTTKQAIAAEAVNQLIYEICSASIEGKVVKDRCFVIVIGYGEEIKVLLARKTSDLGSAILRVEEQSVMLQTGTRVDIKVPIYLDPRAEGSTPMDAAFNGAFTLAAPFCKTYPNSFPPVVINITEGRPNDLQLSGSGEITRQAAQRLLNLSTRQGSLLLFHAHFGDPRLGPVVLPSDKAQLKDHYSQYLFDITSPIPQPLLNLAKMHGFNTEAEARGIVYNANVEVFIKLLNFGGSMALYA